VRVRAIAAVRGGACMVTMAMQRSTRMLAMAGMRSMSVTSVQVATVSTVAMSGGVCSGVVRYAAQRHRAKTYASDTETQHVDVHHWAASRPDYRYGFVVPGI
jgi:hypothetical protein